MMMSGYKNRSEHLIYQRRAQQEKLDTLNGKLKQQFYHKEFAKWENRGADVEKATEMKRRLQELREYARRDLNHRRQRLTGLLESQHFKYQKQIVDSQQTPEQVRARMIERVRVLKEERENEKKQYVNEQLERRFQMNADELRKVDAELKQLRTDLDRNVQLVEKQKILQNKFEEEMLFAELNRRQLKKKEQVERQKEKQARQKVNQRNSILQLQKQMKEQKNRKNKELSKVQKEMLRQQWDREKALEKERQLENQYKQREIAKQLLNTNQIQKKMKEKLIQREKDIDKQLLSSILEKEKEQMEMQKYQRQRQKEEAKKFLAEFKNKNLEGLNQEKELERIIEQERLKREAKQYEQWMKTQQARIRLLRDVYSDRERKVKQNINQRDQEKRIKEQDKFKIQESLKQYTDEQDYKKNQQLIRNREEQERLLEQIRLKEQKRRLLLLQLDKEQTEISKARKQYDQKIQDRKDRGRQQLQQFKKTNTTF